MLDWFWGVHLGLVLDWFWAGIRPKTLIKRFLCSWQKAKTIPEGFRANFVRHYWIGLGEGRIGFGLVSGGPAGGTTGLDTLWVKRNWFRCTIGLDTLSGKQPWRNHSSDNRYRGACIKACGSLWLSLSPKRSPKVQATHMKFSSVSRLWICILPMMFRGYRILLV